MAKAKTNANINGHNYYRLRKKIDGKTKNFYGKSKGDAERKYREYLELYVRDVPARLSHACDRVFSALSINYITNVLNPSEKYANSTKERYESAYETHIMGTWIDNMDVSEIRPSDIQRFYNELDVSKQTLATVNKYMAGFCRWLVLNEYASDFLSAVELPKKAENKRADGIVVLSEDEVRRMLGSIKGHRLCFFVYAMLYTGMRISEAIALEHRDIYDGSIHIVRQCYHGETKPPKYGSKREIPMHEELVGAYMEHRKWQEDDMMEHGYTTNLVFTTSTGRMYDPKSIRTALRRFCDAHGIEYKHPHAFRSTFCTQLCRCGVPIEVASSLMGHKSIEVTAQHYALVKKDTKQDAIAMLRY